VGRLAPAVGLTENSRKSSSKGSGYAGRSQSFETVDPSKLLLSYGIIGVLALRMLVIFL